MSLAVTAVVQLTFLATVSRLLDPADFGVYATAMVIVSLGRIFGQLGLGPAIIQRRSMSTQVLSSAFAFSCLAGLIVTGGILALSPHLARLLGETNAAPILNGLATTFVFFGVSSIPLAVLRREFRFAQLALIETTSSILGFMVVGVLSAFLGLGVWSLVLATLTHASLEAILAFRFSPFPKRLKLYWPDVSPLLRFGGTLSLVGLIQQASQAIGTVGFAHILGAGALGQYNRAQSLVTPVFVRLSTGFSKVLFPGFSSIQDQPRRFRESYLSVVLIVGGVLGPLTGLIAAISTDLVSLVLGDGWILAAQLLPLVVLLLALDVQSHFCGVTLDALGRAGRKLAIELLHIVAAALAVMLIGRFGPIELVFALTVSGAIRLLAYSIVAERSLGGDGRRALVMLGRMAIAALVSYGAALLGRLIVSSSTVPEWAHDLLTIFVAGSLSLVATAALWWLGPLRSARAEVGRRVASVVTQPTIQRLAIRMAASR